jgi:peptidoglycan hydrolase-like protein with peptidoglycan-binding domain
VKKTSKPVPARKAAAKKPARSKSAAPKAKATATRKKPKKAAGKSSATSNAKSIVSSARKSRAGKAGSTKPTPIERASAASKRQTAPAEGISTGSPALTALESTLSGAADHNGTAIADDGYATPAQAGRNAPRRAGTGESADGEGHARANKLVPTNAVHTTKRRMKRNGWQTPAMAVSALAAVLLILALGQETTPPDVSPLEQRASIAVTDSSMHGSDSDAAGARIADPVEAAPEPSVQPKVPSWNSEAPQKAATMREDPMRGLKVLELVEMERILLKLDMGPSQPDGIVDNQTESAIRMYQQIAGLPIDGEPSLELLNDMREVVKMLEPAN